MAVNLQFDSKLIEKYGVSGPRYTSYPTALSFHEGFDDVTFTRHAEQSNKDISPRLLSLYVHIPFCHSLCYFCGCNKKITQHEHHGIDYQGFLDQEIEIKGSLFDPQREVIQLHFGGGTPTFFSDAQLSGVMQKLGQHFNLSSSPQREFSIEIDPRTVDPGRMTHLADIGFNRLSMGVQDFDPAVQVAVNRVQDKQATLDLIGLAREAGFESVSVDLIYGLPLQSPESFMPTIEAVLLARPDRIALYNYAHLPELFRAQRLISPDDMPGAATRLSLMQQSIERLSSAGYVYIGMDHFALPDDELAIARETGELQRNFQGYSTRPDCDLVGLGVSAISKVGSSYAQNFKDIRDWQAKVDTGSLSIWRGISLSREDLLRRRVIEDIMCRNRVCYADIEHDFYIDFITYFATEMEMLARLSEDDLVVIKPGEFVATSKGLLLLRVIAMVFDEHLSTTSRPGGFSKVI